MSADYSAIEHFITNSNRITEIIPVKIMNLLPVRRHFTTEQVFRLSVLQVKSRFRCQICRLYGRNLQGNIGSVLGLFGLLLKAICHTMCDDLLLTGASTSAQRLSAGLSVEI